MCATCGCGHVERFGVHPMQSVPEQPPRLDPSRDGPSGTASGAWHTHADGTVHQHPVSGGHAHTHEVAPGGAASFLSLNLRPAGGEPAATPARSIEVGLPILQRNERLAERNRGFLRALRIVAFNLVSSPGAGKTTLLERTIAALGPGVRSAVVVGDLETARDAERLRAAGAAAVQITTGTVCHLDAEMVARGLEHLDLRDQPLLWIENVGNLVCPSDFDLGEDARVVLLSVTEGEDKPLKYPPVFRRADAVVITKTDLVAACGVDMDVLRGNVARMAPQAACFELSARTGAGMEAWLRWVNSQQGRKR